MRGYSLIETLPFVLIWFWMMSAVFSALIARSHGRAWLIWLVVGLLCGPFGLLVGLMRTMKKSEPW